MVAVLVMEVAMVIAVMKAVLIVDALAALPVVIVIAIIEALMTSDVVKIMEVKMRIVVDVNLFSLPLVALLTARA